MKLVKDLGKRVFGTRLPKQPKEIEAINAQTKASCPEQDPGLARGCRGVDGQKTLG